MNSEQEELQISGPKLEKKPKRRKKSKEAIEDKEGSDAPQEVEEAKKKRRKKKKRSIRNPEIPGTNDEEEREIQAKLEQLEEKRNNRKVKKKRIKRAESDEVKLEPDEERIRDPALAFVLRDLQDDMQSIDDGFSAATSPAESLNLPNAAPSQKVDSVYTEKFQGGFTSKKKGARKPFQILPNSGYNVELPEDGQIVIKQSMTPLEFGIETQKLFRSFGIFCHGFLAGMAFWQVVVVMFLSEKLPLPLDFISLYSPMAQPLQLVFYLLSVICTMSILDRYDFAEMNWKQVQMLLTFRSGGLAIFVYFVATILNLATAQVDDKMSLFAHNSTLFEAMSEADAIAELNQWKILNLCRSLAFIFGWILVALRPNTDLLLKHLKKLQSSK